MKLETVALVIDRLQNQLAELAAKIAELEKEIEEIKGRK